MFARPLRAVLLGLPGSGKGTQGKWLCTDYNATQLSTGDLLRNVAKTKSPMGDVVAKEMAKGGLVSDSTIVGLLTETLSSLKDNQNWLLDGFPRTLSQAESLDSYLSKRQLPLNAVLYIDVDPNLIWLDRIKDRRVHPASGRVYHLKFNPPKVNGVDDETGEPLIVREDDREEVVKARFDAFAKSTAPLLDFYKRKQLLHRIASPTSKEGYVVLQKVLGDLGYSKQ